MTLPIFVDPAVLAFVGVASTVEETKEALELINELSYLSSKFEALVLLTDPEFELTLYTSDAFPFHAKLAPLLHSTGWSDVYDPSAVLAIINGIVQRLTPVNEFTTAQALVIQALSTIPDDAHLANQPGLQLALYEGLALLCSGVHEGSAWIRSTLAALSSRFAASVTLDVDCEVALVEPRIGQPPVDNFKLITSFDRVTSVLDVLRCISAQSLWQSATSDAEIALAIAARANQLRAAAGMAALPRIADHFALGSHFRNSLADAQALQAGPYALATLDTCARICGGLPQPDDSPFYTSAGSGVQRKRVSDDALAHRVHVTKGGIGVRLMYWRLPSGFIEFSNTGPKAHELIFQ